MAVTLQEILAPQVVLEVVSRIKEGQGALGRWLGFQPNRFDKDSVSLNGPNTVSGPTRYPTFRYDDYTRTTAAVTAPGTGPVVVSQTPIGNVQVTCMRLHEKVPLNGEFLSNLSPIVGPNSQVDASGQSYIDREIRKRAQRFNNAIEVMAAGMMRDSLYIITTATAGVQKWQLSFSAATSTQGGFRVNFQVPAGNKTQLDMLGTGNIITQSWANVGAPILTDINKITAAFQQLSGFALSDVWINSLLWDNIVQNTSVRNAAGSSNQPFADYSRTDEKGMDGEAPIGNSFTAILRGVPWLTWHINNDVLVLNSDIDPVLGTAPSAAALSKVVPDDMAIFCTRPNRDWCTMYHGGELVTENPGMPMVRREGYYFWKEFTTQPSSCDLIALLNAIPLLYVPKAIAPATVTGF